MLWLRLARLVVTVAELGSVGVMIAFLIEDEEGHIFDCVWYSTAVDGDSLCRAYPQANEQPPLHKGA